MQSNSPASLRSPIVGSATAPTPLKWRLLSVLAALLPGFGAAYGAYSVIGVLRAMTFAGVGGAGAVSAGLYESNQAVILAGVAGVLLSMGLALLVVSRPGRASALPGPIFSGLIALVASVPALLLWRAESLVIDVICDRIPDSVAVVVEVSRDLATLTIASVVCGLVGPALLLVVASISRLFSFRPQAAPPMWTRIVTWAGVAILLVAITMAFFVRSTALRNAAMAGSCEALGGSPTAR